MSHSTTPPSPSTPASGGFARRSLFALVALVLVVLAGLGIALSLVADSTPADALALDASTEVALTETGYAAEVLAVNQETLLSADDVAALVDPAGTAKISLVAATDQGFCLQGFDPAGSFWNSASQALYYDSGSETVVYSADECLVH